MPLLGRNEKQSHPTLSNGSGSCSHPLGTLLLWKILAFLCHVRQGQALGKCNSTGNFFCSPCPVLCFQTSFNQSVHRHWHGSNVGQTDRQTDSLQGAKARTKPDARRAEAGSWLTWRFGRWQTRIFQWPQIQLPLPDPLKQEGKKNPGKVKPCNSPGTVPPPALQRGKDRHEQESRTPGQAVALLVLI